MRTAPRRLDTDKLGLGSFFAASALVAELAPRPDIPSSVRKLPTHAAMSLASVPAAMSVSSEPTPATAPLPAMWVPTPRPIVRATAPERYRAQFTIGAKGHEKLRRLQALLRREIPDGDAGVIVRSAGVNPAPLI